MKLVADGMRKLCEYADGHGINVVIENHGGLSSNGKWLVNDQAGRPQACRHAAGLRQLPDRRPGPQQPRRQGRELRLVVGVAEMMPLAKGVSVKPRVWDANGNRATSI